MFEKIKKKFKKFNKLIITSVDNNVNYNIKKNSSFFSPFYFKNDDFIYYNYFFYFNQQNINKNKENITIVANEKTPEHNNNNNWLYENQLIGIDTTEEMSSNDIVSGLPKLNSLLENSFEAENTQYFLSNLNLDSLHLKELKINNYYLTINRKEGELEGLKKNNQRRENKDPEILLWSLFSNYKIKNSLIKSLIYCTFKTKSIILNSLVKVYKDQNIKLQKKIFAGVVNTMFNRVYIAETISNPFIKNDEIYIKLYLKLIKLGISLNFIPPIGLPFVEGISKSVTNSPRLLNSISFRDTTNSLIYHSLYQPKDWLTSIKSKLILGQRIDIGTSMFIKSKPYNNINNFLINS